MANSFGQPPTRVYTVAEAAAVLRIGRSTLYDRMSRGEVPHRRVAGKRLMTQADVDAVLATAYRPAVA